MITGLLEEGGDGDGADSFKKEEEDDEGEMRMHCLCTTGGVRECSSVCKRREKEPAWNGGALEQHRRRRQDYHHLHSHCHAGYCVNGRESQSVCMQHWSTHIWNVIITLGRVMPTKWWWWVILACAGYCCCLHK